MRGNSGEISASKSLRALDFWQRVAVNGLRNDYNRCGLTGYGQRTCMPSFLSSSWGWHNLSANCPLNKINSGSESGCECGCGWGWQGAIGSQRSNNAMKSTRVHVWHTHIQIHRSRRLRIQDSDRETRAQTYRSFSSGRHLRQQFSKQLANVAIKAWQFSLP